MGGSPDALASATKGPPLGGSRILLVDDYEPVLLAWARVVRAAGAEVDTATDGAEALRLLMAGQYDAIASDIAMSGMTGIELLRAAKARQLDLPFVLVSGQPTLETALQAIEHGVFRYIPKPVDAALLVDVLRKAVQMRRMATLRREAMRLVAAIDGGAVDEAGLSASFESALTHLRMAYQPIVTPAGELFGYEALMRSAEPRLSNPKVILDAAEQLGRLHELGQTVRSRVAARAPESPADTVLFVNIHTRDLNDAHLMLADSPLSQIATRVVLEITERASVHDVADLRTRATDLQALGFRIAIDDLGAGYAGLASFAALEPEFVKLDISLVRDVDKSLLKRKIIRSITAVSRDMGIRVIGEGVETMGEKRALEDAGCDLLEGYLFGRPNEVFLPPSKA